MLAHQTIQTAGDANAAHASLAQLHHLGYVDHTSVQAAAVTAEIWPGNHDSQAPAAAWANPEALARAVLPPLHLLPSAATALEQALADPFPGRRHFLVACAVARGLPEGWQHDPALQPLRPAIEKCGHGEHPSCDGCKVMCGTAAEKHTECCLGTLALNRSLYWMAGTSSGIDACCRPFLALSKGPAAAIVSLMASLRLAVYAHPETWPQDLLGWLVDAQFDPLKHVYSLFTFQQSSEEFVQDLQLQAQMSQKADPVLRMARWLQSTCIHAAVRASRIPSLLDLMELVRLAATMQPQLTEADLSPYWQVLQSYHDAAQCHYNAIRRLCSMQLHKCSLCVHGFFTEWCCACSGQTLAPLTSSPTVSFDTLEELPAGRPMRSRFSVQSAQADEHISEHGPLSAEEHPCKGDATRGLSQRDPPFFSMLNFKGPLCLGLSTSVDARSSRVFSSQMQAAGSNTSEKT